MVRQVDIRKISDDEPLVALSRAGRAYTLRLTNSIEEPLTEYQIVLATLAAANGARLYLDGSRGGDRGLAQLRELSAAVQKHVRSDPTSDDSSQDLDERWRESVVAILDGIISGVMQQVIAEDPTTTTEIHGLQMRPMMKVVDGKLRLVTHYSFAIEHSLVSFGELLLADSSRDFGSKLCRCRLKSCGLFFLERRPPTGRPQRIYCCDEHLTQGHNSGSGERRKRAAKRKAGAKHK